MTGIRRPQRLHGGAFSQQYRERLRRGYLELVDHCRRRQLASPASAVRDPESLTRLVMDFIQVLHDTGRPLPRAVNALLAVEKAFRPAAGPCGRHGHA